MDFNEYQELAHRTSGNDDSTLKEAISMAALGLNGEAGEIADYIKKYIYHGHRLEWKKLKEEAGDVLWYIAELCTVAGHSLEEVAEYNITKLKARYPEGFSTERSINRNKFLNEKNYDE